MSIYRLSIAIPLNAAIKCSTVDIRALPSPTVVASRVSKTAACWAGISTAGLRSVRMKRIPVLTGAGRSVRRTFSPVCKPIPVALMAFFNVLCLIIPDPSLETLLPRCPRTLLLSAGFNYYGACVNCSVSPRPFLRLLRPLGRCRVASQPLFFKTARILANLTLKAYGITPILTAIVEKSCIFGRQIE